MKIITDTGSLISPAEGKKLGIISLPTYLINKDVAYRDFEEITVEDFLNMAKEGIVLSASQSSMGELTEILEETTEDTLVLLIADGLSGGYQNALGIKNSIDNNDHIRVIDTKSLAGCEYYLVEKAVRLRDEGADLDTIEKELVQTADTSVSFVIPADFNFLKRSGRLTPVAADFVNIVKVVPVLTQTEDMKKITLFAIKRSKKKAVEAIIAHLKKMGVNEEYLIYVCHGGDVEGAEAVCRQLKEQFADTELRFTSLSPSLLNHGGPGCVVVQAIKK